MKGYAEISLYISPVSVLDNTWVITLWSGNHDTELHYSQSAITARKVAHDWFAKQRFSAWELNDQSDDTSIDATKV